MGTVAGVGRSQHADERTAGREAAEKALQRIGAPASAAMVFATAAYDQKALIGAVRDVLGDAAISGCSGEGIITLGESVEHEHAIAVMALRSDSLSFEAVSVGPFSEDPNARGRELVAGLGGTDDVVGVFLFPDGLSGNCTDLLEGMAATTTDLTIVGGTSGDGMQFEQTYQYCNGDVSSDSVAALVVRGKGRIEVAVSHGCTTIGTERTITRAEGAWVHEIDGKPAWSVFKEYLDGDPEDLNAEGVIFLSVGQQLENPTADYDEYVVRTPMQLDKETGALFFPGGDVRTGQRIRLTRRDPDRISESAVSCARRIAQAAESAKPALVLQFDCAGRGRVLFGSSVAERIVCPLQDTIGDETPWIGFHTFGEIAPIGDRPYFHNYTVALCALYDG